MKIVSEQTNNDANKYVNVLNQINKSGQSQNPSSFLHREQNKIVLFK